MKVIVLKGRGSVGKTATMKKVIEKLAAAPDAKGPHYRKSPYKVNPKCPNKETEKYDRFCSFSYQEKHVIVATGGDNPESIREVLNICATRENEGEKPVDVLLIPCRTKGDTLAVINELPDKIILDKLVVSGGTRAETWYEPVNEIDAERLLKTLKDLISDHS